MAAQYRIELGQFFGNGGSLQAQAFIRKVDNAIQASDIEPERMAGMVKNALKGSAEMWLENQTAMGTAGLGSWTTLRPLMVAKFCKQLTVAELAALERTLEHKQGERVEEFFTRCQRFVLESDADTTNAHRATDAYKLQFERKIKFAFLKGLKEEVRRAMAGTDVNAATCDELLAAANNAETLTMKKSEASAEAKKPEVDAVFQQGFTRGRGGQRGRGNFRGRGGRPNSRNRNFVDYRNLTPDDARAKGLTFCRRHQNWGKHSEADCRATDLPMGPSYNRGGTGGGFARGRGGGARRSYANAAGASDDPGNEFQPWAYDEPPASGNA
jgi:hypothetical protein